MTNLVGDSATQSVPAVQGTNTAGGLGVYGISTTGDSGSAGVEGVAQQGGIGVYGVANYGPSVMGEGGASAVLGKNYVGSGMAIQGWQNGANGYGVYGQATGNYSTAIHANSSGYQGIGLWANAAGSGGVAAILNGPVTVSGYLSKSGGGFHIDHPMDPENKFLNHCFVESPEMKNVYDGVITLNDKGEATVVMPSYFNSCNSDFRYQLTALGASMPNLFVSSEMKSGAFSIAGGVANAKVSWQITGVRSDKWALVNHPGVEQDKSAEEKGFFLHPELLGHGREKSIHRSARAAEPVVHETGLGKK